MAEDNIPDAGELLLTDREVVIVLQLLDTFFPTDVPTVFGSVGSVRITPERVRQIQGRLLGRLRGAAGRGRYGPALRTPKAEEQPTEAGATVTRDSGGIPPRPSGLMVPPLPYSPRRP
jgi:hypothetical protein